MVESIDSARSRERLEELGRAIRRLRGPMTQQELGDLIGEAQTTLSRWEAGMVDLGVTQLHTLESALRVAHGTLARAAGYVSDELIEEEAVDGFRVGVFDEFDDALIELLAANALGIGVRVFNRWSTPDAEGAQAIEWVVVLLVDAPEVA